VFMKKLMVLAFSTIILLVPCLVQAEETSEIPLPFPESEALPPEGSAFEQEDIFTLPVTGDAPSNVSAGGDTYTKYPNSNITVKTGDILVSSKSFAATRFVGHVAIVGTDHNVKEVLPKAPGDNIAGQSVSLKTFRTNQSGYAVKVYRHPKSSVAISAGTWATNNVNKTTHYMFTSNLSSLNYNYCSKFVFQSFLKGAGEMVVYPAPLNMNTFGEITGLVYPSQFNAAGTYIGSFK